MIRGFSLSTPSLPGAIAIIDITAPDIEQCLSELTGRDQAWPTGDLFLRSLLGVDDGIVVRLGESRAQLMPHGGTRVVQILRDRLLGLGYKFARDLDPRVAYPEAASLDEALMLHLLAIAESCDAIDLLLDQPRRWAAYRSGSGTQSLSQMRRRSAYLNRLVRPASVVVAGAPNVGKSTLLNALTGRSTSITADTHGTTRDYVGAQVDLAGLTVWWFDTPGHRRTDDAVEAMAIGGSQHLIESAEMLILAGEPDSDIWPVLSRRADLTILLKADLLPDPPRGGKGRECLEIGGRSVDLAVSAQTGQGMKALVQEVREFLVPARYIDDPGAWIFDARLTEESDAPS